MIINNTLIENRYGIRLSDCSNIDVKQNRLLRNPTGILPSGIRSCLFEDNIFINNNNGIFLRSCDSNEFIDNYFYNNSEYGLCFYDFCDYNHVIGNYIELSDTGILLSGTEHALIQGNIIISCVNGIEHSTCDFNTLKDNNFYKCGLIFHYFLDYTYYRTNSIDSSNRVNDRNLYFYYDREDLDSLDFLNAGQVILINCKNSQISNLDGSEGSIGIYLSKCENILIKDVICNNNTKYGIYTQYSNNIEIAQSIINYNPNGIYVYQGNNSEVNSNQIGSNSNSGVIVSYSGDISFDRNNFTNNFNGINIRKPQWKEDTDKLYVLNNEFGYHINAAVFMEHCDEEVLNNNSVHNNYYGFFLSRCKLNNILNNQMSYNDYGIYFYYSNNNTICQNMFGANFINYYLNNSIGNDFFNNTYL